MLAAKHPRQELRLATLDSYEILDTPAESDFDDVVELASQICDVPVSLITLVDGDRQWFKARVGLPQQETSLEESVCSHAILQDAFLEIPDMGVDPRTADNPLHTDDPRLNFYAGANLVAPNGMAIGTLCVLDTKPRKLNDFQKQALQTLSRQVMVQLELRKRLLAEKGLRKEMDHRVKNSLQHISSVVRVAGRGVSDPAALDVLGLVERRISSVGLLHTELMGGESSNEVQTAPYLSKVVGLLDELAPDNIALLVEAEDVPIRARKASAIGMIVSEFVANSIKHAFPDGQDGQVRVTLQSDGNRGWTLRCSDDGVGRENGGASSDPDSTGLGAGLTASAVAQLEGELHYDDGGQGTALVIGFSI